MTGQIEILSLHLNVLIARTNQDLSRRGFGLQGTLGLRLILMQMGEEIMSLTQTNKENAVVELSADDRAAQTQEVWRTCPTSHLPAAKSQTLRRLSA